MWSRAFINKNSKRNKGLCVDRGLEKSFLCKFAFSHLTWADGCLFLFFCACVSVHSNISAWSVSSGRGGGLLRPTASFTKQIFFLKSWKLKPSVKSPLKCFLRNWQGANVDELWGTCFCVEDDESRDTLCSLFFLNKVRNVKLSHSSISTNWGYHLLFSFCNSWF